MLEYEKEPQNVALKNEELQEKRFRISVSLERYFSDERARCFISVSSRRRVHWLRRRLRRLFALPQHFALITRGHLLPPDEPLALLAADDRVDVIPVQNEIQTNDSLDNLSLSFTLGIEDQERKGTKRYRKHSTSSENEIRHTDPLFAIVNEARVPSREQKIIDIDTVDAATQDLCEMKRRALALLDSRANVTMLDNHAGPLDSHAARLDSGVTPFDSHAVPLDSHVTPPDNHGTSSDCHAAPRKRRRRVRRRRAAAKQESMSSPSGVTERDAAAGVVRNGADAARAPRVVRSLEHRDAAAPTSPSPHPTPPHSTRSPADRQPPLQLA